MTLLYLAHDTDHIDAVSDACRCEVRRHVRHWCGVNIWPMFPALQHPGQQITKSQRDDAGMM